MSGDSFSPDAGQVLNPDGTATYDFQGHIGAIGLDIVAGDGFNPAADRKIRWHKDTLTGAVVAEMQTFQVPAAIHPSGAYNELDLDVYSADGQGYAILSLAGQSAGSSDPSRITATTQDIPGAAGNVTIIDGDGQSSFPQLVGALRRGRLAIDSTFVTFDGTLNYAISDDVPHTFGATPMVLASLAEYFDLGHVAATAMPYAVTNTKFNVLVYAGGAVPAAGDQANVNYLAFL